MTSSAKLTLRPLPHLEFIAGFPGIPASSQRAAAHIAGSVEVRLRGGLKASFLRIELRKLESVPGGETWGELVGRGPTSVWTARPGKGAGDREEDAEGCWELLTTADFPFRIAIPEGLPPTARLDKQCGVSYELVTSLCVRGKKGLLRSAPTSSIVQSTHPIVIEKHELHSTWPVYNVPDEHEAENDGIICRVEREQTCYGPGDTVTIRVLVRSRRVTPVKLKSVAFSLRETVTFRGGAGGAKASRLSLSGSSGAAASQRTETIAQKSKSSSKKLYKDEEQEFILTCQIPRSHALPTITTAKHIEVAYTMRVYVDISKAPIVVDHLPLTLSAFSSAASREITPKIGFVPGLSDVEPDQSTTTSGRGAGRSMTAESSYAGGMGGMSRSQSFSSSAAGRVFGVGGVRRRDTVMSQGTTTSGPGMAGRGVPGQMFGGWAQPYQQPNSYAAPHAAFAGQDGQQGLAPEEGRALFHHTNRPDSAAMFGVDQRDTLLAAPGVYSANNSAPSSSVRLASPALQDARVGAAARLGTPQDDPTRDHVSFTSSSSPSATPNPHASPVMAHSNKSSALAAQQAQLARFTSANNAAASGAPKGRPATADTTVSTHRAAEEEKMRLYERARQQAERNQRRADEVRAQQAALGAAKAAAAAASNANGAAIATQHGRSSSAAPGVGGSSSTPASSRIVSAPAPYVSAEQEKARLYERARKEAEKYQSGYTEGASFPPEARAPTALANGAATANGSAHASPAKAAPPPSIVTGATAAASAASRPQSQMIDRAYMATLSPADREAEERRRSSAKYWLDSPHVDIPATAVEAPPPHGGVIGGSGATQSASLIAPSAARANVPGSASVTASSTLRAYPTAEEEKRRLYEKAKAEQEAAERDANARSGAAAPGLVPAVATPALDLPGAWPANTPQLSPQPQVQLQLHSPPPAAAAPLNARDEKAQLALYHQAQDAVARTQQQSSSAVASPQVSAASPSFNNSFAPAYQAQASRLLTALPAAGMSDVSPMTTPLPAENKLAYSFASPAPSRLVSSPSPLAGAGGSSSASTLPAAPQQTSAISEKEQLRLYYAARDAQSESERVAAELAASGGSAAAGGASPALARPAASYAANYARTGDARVVSGPATGSAAVPFAQLPASGSAPSFSAAPSAGGYAPPPPPAGSAPSSHFLPSQVAPPATVPGHAYSGSSASAYALASPAHAAHDNSIARGKQRSLSPALPSPPTSPAGAGVAVPMLPPLSFGEASHAVASSSSHPQAYPQPGQEQHQGHAQRMPSIYAPRYAKSNWEDEEPHVEAGAAPPPLPPKLPPKTPIM